MSDKLNSSDDMSECPLCMEPLEIDDLSFYPCTCGYQICRFCWHRIRTDENGLCPACRKAYQENPADFKPLTPEELQRIKQEKKQKDLQRKQKVSENRKHLANVRVVQKNLVFVVGLSARLSEAETLRKTEYFGKFGRIHKVVTNLSSSYAGSQQGPSASAYVTYFRAEDALRAISVVNNLPVDGRTLKASLGTTKYCAHFMKNQPCPKPDCMYLHELGDETASFTKEEMQQGKHQEFEKKLQDYYLGTGEKSHVVSISGLKGASRDGQARDDVENLAPATREGHWPALKAPSAKETKRRRGGKGDRRSASVTSGNVNGADGSSKRSSQECEKQINQASGGSGGCNSLESFGGGSPFFLNMEERNVASPSSSNQDSCLSSASTSPPPGDEEGVLIPPTPPPASSPVLVRGSRGSSSPLPTPPSSLSDDSEPSHSLPPPPANSLFSDSNHSFFSNGGRLFQQPMPSQGVSTPPPGSDMNQAIQCLHGLTSQSDWTSLQQQTTSHFTITHSPTITHSWDAMFHFDRQNDSPTCDLGDDDLGFDPFEETNKGLAEELRLEQLQREELQRVQIQRQHQSQDPFSGGLQRAKLPPPGFNGLKGMSPFMAAMGMSNGIGHPPGMNGLCAPPGLHVNAISLLAMGADAPMCPPSPPGMPQQSRNKDMFRMGEMDSRLRGFRIGEMDSGLRGLIASSSMGNLNTLGGSHGGHGMRQLPQQMSQQLPSSQQLSYNMQHMTINSLYQNGWGGNNSATVPDITALDPAIVSSGQLTDPRSDSPPHWMKSLEQQFAEPPIMGGSGGLWHNVLPINLTMNGISHMPNHQSMMHQQPPQRAMGGEPSIWPPTSPPPGFNSLSPLHHAKQPRECHSIENF